MTGSLTVESIPDRGDYSVNIGPERVDNVFELEQQIGEVMFLFAGHLIKD